MPVARFSLGDRVFLLDAERPGRRPGLYEVIRVLPFERSTRQQYRVQLLQGGEQRLVDESEMVGAPKL